MRRLFSFALALMLFAVFLASGCKPSSGGGSAKADVGDEVTSTETRNFELSKL